MASTKMDISGSSRMLEQSPGGGTPKHPKKAKKSDISTVSARMTPEGNSILIRKKAQLLVPSDKSLGKKVTPKSKMKSSHSADSMSVSSSASTLKKTHKRRSSGSSEVNESPASSKKLRLSDNIEYSEVNSQRDSEVSIANKTSLRLKKKQPSKKVAENDSSWEQAVEKARGLPDGADQSDEELEEAKMGKKSQFEKGKKKPLNVINSAAKKLRKFTDESQKGTKRKLGDDAEAEKKKKSSGDGLTRKERKQQRRVLKNNYDLSQKCKNLWEQIRRTDCPERKRLALCTELHSVVKGKAAELMFCHDTSRVIQCLMKYGMPEVKTALFEELRDKIVEMCKSKYAKFFVRKLLKYGTKAQRDYVFRSLYGKVRRLIKHREAAEIIECAYNDYANKQQRDSMIEEFYGPSFVLFKTPNQQTLEEIVKSSPEKRNSILSNMKATLNILIGKTLLQYSLIHKLFLEYFTYATDELRSEMIQCLRESVIHMLHTRDGSRVTMHCLWYGTAKDRKVIIKSMKTYVVKVCKEEYGHLVMLTLLDTLDDTKLVQKVILEEMLKSVKDLSLDQYGRKILLYLMSPRDPRHFHPDVVKILEQGDSNPYSKKDMSTRRDELLEAVSAPLLEFVASNCKELMLNNATLMLVLVMLSNAKGNPENAMKAICKIVGEPFASGTVDNFHIVENPAGHLAVKRLILSDRERIKCEQPVLFSEVLVQTIPPGSLKSWAACNRGCFILLSLLDIDRPLVTQKVMEELNPVKKSLSKLNFKGAQILMGRLKDQHV